ncbi:MAG: NAD kinase [Alphaproteobacteria bacterium]|nr:NAD kinase [Alphaproteobacteria bacterium]
MNMYKHFLVETSDGLESIKSMHKIQELCKKYSIKTTSNPHDKNIDAILVIGGDGQMLRSFHNLYHLNLPFFGINAGSIGFLMNNQSAIDLIPELHNLPKISLCPLDVHALDSKGEAYSRIAFNEITVSRSTSQAAKLTIEINNILQMEELIADGIIVSTPAGSSAYNFSAGGRIVPLESNLMCITPICAFRPRRWEGAILPDYSCVKIKSLENSKRPVNIIADFFEVSDIITAEIKKHHNIKVDIIFASRKVVDEKMIKEQFII